MDSSTEVQPISIYLAGPVDGIKESEAMGWREELKEKVPASVLLYSPVHAFFNETKHTAWPMMRINYGVIRECDAMLVNLTGPGRGFGTVREIEYAMSIANTYVSVAGRWVEDSLYSWGLPVHDTVDEALNDIIHKIVEWRNRPATFMGLPIRLDRQEPDDTI